MGYASPDNPNGRVGQTGRPVSSFGRRDLVEFTGSASASFSASHVVKDHPRCGRMHGHRWRVEVEISAGQDPATGELMGLPALADAVETFCQELDRENVNDMLPGTSATPAGVGLVLRERLALHFVGILSVTVWADDVSVTLHA